MRGKKGYVALNTLVKDYELSKVKEELRFLSSIGVDGIIVQDAGIASLVKNCVPDIPLHGSTQMTVHNLEGVELLRNKGVERIVLSRELAMDDIEHIRKNTDCELEIFIHGALCVCYSGQCYMSSFIGERSGNRGRCAQPCRLAYSMADKKGTLLSLKDMESTDYIKKIKELEIESLKIEGRLKNEYYTAVVVDSYRKLLDGYELSKKDKQMLFDIFNRGGYTTYFDGEKRNMFCYNKQEIPYSETELEAEKKFKERILDETVPDSVKIPLFMKIELEADKHPVLTGTAGGKTKTVYGDIKCEQALNGTISVKRVEESLAKLGATPFRCEEIKTDIGDNVYISVSSLNSLRRKLTDELSDDKKIKFYDYDIKNGRRNKASEPEFVISVTTKEQYEWAKNKNCKYLIVPVEIAEDVTDVEKTVVSLPPVITLKETDEIKSCLKRLREKGIKYGLANNISHYEFLKDFEVIASGRINIMNSESVNFLPETKLICVSKELNLKDISFVLKDREIMAEAYGYQSMMITENCIKKNVNGKCINSLSYLKDRKGQKFPVLCVKGCRNEILNSVPLVMSDKLSELKKSGVNYLLLSFTIENKEECEEVLTSYLTGENHIRDFTRGHFFRGVQ